MFTIENLFVHQWVSIHVSEYILYTRLSSSRVIFALLLLQTVSPRPEFAQTQFYLKKDNF